MIPFISFNQSVKEEYRTCAVESYQQGDFASALTYFTDVILLDPFDSIAYFDRGLLYEKLHDFRSAIADFSKQIQIDSSNVDSYFLRGIVACKIGELDGALRDLIKVSELEEGNADAHFFRGLIREEQGNYKYALADFTKAIKMNPEHIDARIERGFVYLKQHHTSKALLDFNAAEKLDTNNVLISLYKSWGYVQKREPEKTIACLKNAIAIDPVGVVTSKILQWMCNKEYNFLLKTIEYNVNSKNALECCVLNLITHHEEIAYSIADSLRLQNPNDCDALYMLSIVHEKKGNDSAAMSAINQAIACKPMKAPFYLKRALLFLKQNNSNQACGDFKSFLEYTEKLFLNTQFNVCYN